MSITTITEAEQRLSNVLQMTSDTLELVRQERDALRAALEKKRKPLDKTAILALWNKATNHFAFARLIEAAHDITEPDGAATPGQTNAITAEWLEERAHRRCRRYVFIDSEAPYQFNTHTLMDLARDVAMKIKGEAR